MAIVPTRGENLFLKVGKLVQESQNREEGGGELVGSRENCDEKNCAETRWGGGGGGGKKLRLVGCKKGKRGWGQQEDMCPEIRGPNRQDHQRGGFCCGSNSP